MAPAASAGAILFPMHKTLLAGAILLSLCLLPFLAGINGPFFLDDQANLLRARAPTGLVADVVDAVLRNSSGPLRRPVSNASFLLNYHWIGTTPFDYKVVNLVVHLACGLLLWRLAALLLQLLAPSLSARPRSGVALLTAAVWVIHPLQVSTVLYAVQRMAQLSALFLFAALLLATATLLRLREPMGRGQALLRMAGVYTLVALSVLSKENGALFPLLLCAIVLCAPAALVAGWRRNPGARWFLGSGMVLPLIAGTIALAVALPRLAGAYAMRDFTMAERLFTEPVVLGHYLLTLVWPDVRLMGLYLDDFTIRTATDPATWLGLLCVFGSVAIALAVRRRAPLAAFAVLWFLAAHAMESTVIPLEIAFEHRNYLALLGPVLAIVYLGYRLAARLPGRQAVLLALLPLLVLAGLTARRAHYWSSTDLFVEQEVANHPESPRALTHAAARAIALGDLATAAQRIRAAQRRSPNSFWMDSYDLHLACEGMDLEPDWHGLLRQAQERPQEMGIDEALRLVVGKVTAETCPAIAAEKLDGFVGNLVPVMEHAGRPEVVERLLILRHHLATHAGEPGTAASFLDAAIAANPKGLEALTLAAYAALNAGELERARKLAGELEARIDRYYAGSRAYVVQELRGYIAQEERSGA